MRNYLYTTNKIYQISPPIFTISVGNISWGGTGKTPLCEFILNLTHKNGIRSVLLSRGYRGKPPHYPYVVDISSPVIFSGDEPLMLKKMCPFSSVIVDPKRERGIFFAWKKFKPHIAILDDGFQYRRLKRHLDIVLFSPSDLKKWNRLIPYGTWRESENSINRADVLMINVTGEDISYIKSLARKKLEKYKKPIFLFNTQITDIVCSISPKKQITSLPKRYVLVTGIGNPERVYCSVKEFLGHEPIKFFKFQDHHKYTKRDWDKISKYAKNHRALVVTTPKDSVKLEKFSHGELYTLALKTTIISSLGTDKKFEDIIMGSFLEYKSSHGYI